MMANNKNVDYARTDTHRTKDDDAEKKLAFEFIV